MRRDPLVSVLISNYNYGRFVGEAIESALAQTYGSLEVIVVDDGSTDDSRDVIGTYGSSVKTIYKRNGGQASAFNAGFQASRGSILCFLDADDLWFPEKVSVVVENMVRSTANGVPRPAMLRHNLVLATDLPSVTRHSLVTPGAGAREWPKVHDLSQLLVSRQNAPSSAIAIWRDTWRPMFPIPEDAFRISADAYIYTFAPQLGTVVDCAPVLGLYRIHGANNFFGTSKAPSRLRTDTALAAHLADVGIVPVLRSDTINDWHAADRSLREAIPLSLRERLWHLASDRTSSRSRRLARMTRELARSVVR